MTSNHSQGYMNNNRNPLVSLHTVINRYFDKILSCLPLSCRCLDRSESLLPGGIYNMGKRIDARD